MGDDAVIDANEKLDNTVQATIETHFPLLNMICHVLVCRDRCK
jgi:hypothetical protein